MKPATRHLCCLPLHQDLRPALETAVSPATPAMAAAVRAPAEAAAPTSIPSYHHGHHPHEGPTPPAGLPSVGHPFCSFKNKVTAPLDLHIGCLAGGLCWWAPKAQVVC